jgi:putative DNA primase/helicase
VSASIYEAIRAAGLAPTKELDLPDGKLVRYRVEGDKGGSTNGWAVLYSHPVMAGAFGSWKSGESHTWHAQSSKPQTPAESAALQQQIKAVQQARANEQAVVHELARSRATRLWALAKPATNAHPYLQRKGVPAIGIRQLRNMLVIPARDSIGVLHTLQFILEDGSKRFLTGGRITGCYFSIGKPFDSLLITEGLATASTLYEATGRAVAVCFSCTNMAPVARALRLKFPRLRLILCADNDFKTPGNPGVTHARAAAQAVDGYLAVPQFAEVAP